MIRKKNLEHIVITKEGLKDPPTKSISQASRISGVYPLDGRVKKLTHCPICRINNFTEHLSGIDFLLSKEEFTIVRCANCCFLFTNPRPEDHDLERYYLSSDYISHTNSSKGLLNWLYQKARLFALGKKLKLINNLSQKGKLLDIGCGTGEFLNICKKNSWLTRGVEPSDLARNQAIKNYKLNVSDNLDLSQFDKDSFDIVTLWHVLEHLPNLEETVDHLELILKENGKVIIAVPNYKSWDACYYKKYWAAYDLPIHLWHFSKNTISQLFTKHGFSLVKTKGMILDSFYVSILSEKYKTGKENFIKAFVIGMLSNIMGLFTKRGYSSTIYVFEKLKIVERL